MLPRWSGRRRRFNETPAEQAVTRGDPAALGDDVVAARASGQTPAGASDIADE